MTQILIIEDEKSARDRLKLLISQCFTEKVLIEECSSLRDAQPALEKGRHYDLIFMDILLSDGCSMDLFEKVDITAPVVFTTANEDYWLRSFETNGIDYILKPYGKKDIQEAIAKYQKLNRHFQRNKISGAKEGERKRILVRKGFSFLSINLDEIAYFYTEHKLTLMKDKSGNRYMVDRTLGELEASLVGPVFFRLNRQFLCHIESVKSFKSHSKGRLCVALEPCLNEEVIISQENASRFKKWMDGIPEVSY